MTPFRDWWEDDATEIGQLTNTEHGVDSIHARQVDGEWEYVRIWWRYRTPSVSWILRGGKIVEGAEDE